MMPRSLPARLRLPLICCLLCLAGCALWLGQQQREQGRLQNELRRLQRLSPPLPPVVEETPPPAADGPPSVAPIATLPETPLPRLDGRLSRQARIISEWHDGSAHAPADPALAVGDSPAQTLLPPGSLRIHRGSAP